MKRHSAPAGGVGHLVQPNAIVDVREGARAVKPSSAQPRLYALAVCRDRFLAVDRLCQLALEDEHEACWEGRRSLGCSRVTAGASEPLPPGSTEGRTVRVDVGYRAAVAVNWAGRAWSPAEQHNVERVAL